MKQALIFSLFLLLTYNLQSQSTTGFRYQAVVRNAEQELLKNHDIVLKVQLLSDIRNKQINYEEIHELESDDLGIINAVIGEGIPTKGKFDNIPWDTESIWINVMIDMEGDGNFISENYSKLLAVPYAMYAKKAGSISDSIVGTRDYTEDDKLWSLLGNKAPEGSVLGTLNPVDLVVITAGEERMRINTLGNANFEHSVSVSDSLESNVLIVSGLSFFQSTIYGSGDFDLEGNLTAQANAFFKENVAIDGDIDVAGVGRFRNTENSTGIDTGALIVKGGVGIGKDVWIGGELNVEGDIKGSGLVINGSREGPDDEWDSYPIQVTGIDQGIAVKIDRNKPNSTNNFITFFDEDEDAVGRIEGQTKLDILQSEEWIVETAFQAAAIGSSIGALTSLAVGEIGAVWSLVNFVKDVVFHILDIVGSVCAAIGASGEVVDTIITVIEAIFDIVFGVVSEVASIAGEFVDATVLAFDVTTNIASIITYQVLVFESAGSTFSSGSADYAEWLPKMNPEDKFNAGDVVGIVNGKITKDIDNAQKLMVISSDPIVLGNMPKIEEKHLYEKVAFLGQVPVKVNGPVNSGDYLIAQNDEFGFAKAIAPKNITLDECKNIVGVSWSDSKVQGVNYVNAAVGLNQNDLIPVIENQVIEMENIKHELNEVKDYILKRDAVLAELVPGYKDRMTESPFEFDQIDKTYLTSVSNNIEEQAVATINNSLYGFVNEFTQNRSGDKYYPTDNAQLISALNKTPYGASSSSLFNMTGPLDGIEGLVNNYLNVDYFQLIKDEFEVAISDIVNQITDEILETKTTIVDEIASQAGLVGQEVVLLDEKINEILPIFDFIENAPQLIQEITDDVFALVDQAACEVCNHIESMPVSIQEMQNIVYVPINFFLDVVNFFTVTLNSVHNFGFPGVNMPDPVPNVPSFYPFSSFPQLQYDVNDLPFVDNGQFTLQFPDMCSYINCN